ncbi:hypothetical protein [Streptomyces macrosporus]
MRWPTTGVTTERPDGADAPGGGPDAHGELAFFTDDGAHQRLTVSHREEVPAPDREPLRAGRLVLGTGWKVVQYRLPREARDDHRARDRLEREVGAGLAVSRAYRGAPYARLFPRLAGYHLDTEEPFVFYRSSRGTPLAGLAGRVDVRDQRTIMGDLVLAVRLLEAVGIVHRGITPHGVLWDGERVRLPEPYTATRAGLPREPLGAAPWAGPEQREGRGEADPRDDLWSVAQVMYHLLTGRPGSASGPHRDLAGRPALAVLADAFAPRAADRPRPAEVLRMLNRPDPLEERPLPPDPLEADRRAFDDELARKRRALGLAPAADGDGYGNGYGNRDGGGYGGGDADDDGFGPRVRRGWFGGRGRRR